MYSQHGVIKILNDYGILYLDNVEFYFDIEDYDKIKQYQDL